MAGQRVGFPLSDILLPEALDQCGYRNHLVGKWHLGYYRNEMLPENRGFHSHYGYLNGAEDHYTRTTCNQHWNDPICGVDFRDNGENRNITFGQYSSELYTKKIEELVANHDLSEDKPLFIYAGLQNVHYPMEAPDEYINEYKWINDPDRRIYAAMTKALDESVGRIISSFKLKSEKFWENTIVYFTTDNGGSTLFGGNNFPYRGIKVQSDVLKHQFHL